MGAEGAEGGTAHRSGVEMSFIFDRSGSALRKGLLAAAIAVPAAAGAQQQIAVTQTENPDSGIRMGTARLNPTFEFETRYDSQAGFVQEAGGGFKGVGDLILHVRPGLRFKAPSETLELTFKGNYDYQAYLGTEDDSLTDQSKSAADLDFSAMFNRDGNVRFELADRFVRSDRTSNLSTGINSISNRNDATARLNFRSEGNWAVTAGYTLTSESFDAVSGKEQRDLSKYDYLAHTGRVDARYAVFGKSAIVLDGAVSQRDYTADAKDDQAILREIGNAQVMVGLTGLLMPKLGYTAKVGYGTQFGLEDDRDGFSSAVANAELAWFANQLTDVRVGYLRTFEADPYYAYYQDDRVYLNASSQFGANTRLRAGLAYDTIGFGELGTGTAEDKLLTLSISPEYAFNRYVSGGLSYGFTQRTSDRDSAVSSLYEYDRHEVGARVMFIY